MKIKSSQKRVRGQRQEVGQFVPYVMFRTVPWVNIPEDATEICVIRGNESFRFSLPSKGKPKKRV